MRRLALPLLCVAAAWAASEKPAWTAAPPNRLPVPLGTRWEPPVPTDPADIEARRHVFIDRGWLFVGAARVTGGVVALYCHDSDHDGPFVYPNSFALHAAYQNRAGAWVTKELCSAARVGFDRIEGQTGGVVEVRLRPKCVIMVWSNETRAEAKKRAERINKTFVVRLALPDD